MNKTGFIIEFIHGIVRAGPGYTKRGDPYTFVCNVYLNHDEAHIRAAVGDIPSDGFKLLKERLKELGIKTLYWERVKNGETKKVVIKI